MHATTTTTAPRARSPDRDHHPAERLAYQALAAGDAAAALAAAEQARDAYALSCNDARCGSMARLALMLRNL